MTEQELEELDLAVAEAEGIPARRGDAPDAIVKAPGIWRPDAEGGYVEYNPTRDPVEAMRLLIQMKAEVSYDRTTGKWCVNDSQDGDLMVAICKAVVALHKAKEPA